MDNSEQPDPLAASLVMEAVLPLAWEEAGAASGVPTTAGGPDERGVAMPPLPTRVSLAAANERLLRVALLSDEHPLERSDEEGGHPGELLRIESKLDLVLELLSELLATATEPLPLHPVRLGAAGLEWRQAGTLPAAGDRVMIRLLPDPLLPRPLSLPGRVLKVDDGRVLVRFEAIGETVADLLQRLVFRHHRRQVAQMRQGSPESS